MKFVYVFVVGGLLCAIAQLLIDKTKLSPARIMVSYVVAGVILTAVGIYQPIVDFAGAGATVPIIGFGYSLAKGAAKAVSEEGWLGVLGGGVKGTSMGVAAAIFFGMIFSVFFKPKAK
ncbi:MAG: stage V sporulation protein AE [Clostridia bacterium]|nr:stage V sporulation protein AE [Clostridia bacterium]